MSIKENLPKCQVFTPDKIAKKLLDSVGYKKNITKSYILENSCGNGNVLIQIVERYITSAKTCNLSVKEIKKGLETFIYGYDIDDVCCKICVDNLNKKAAEHDIHNVKWKIYNKDFLEEYTKKNIGIQFNYIVGNPPYINYTELNKETRDFVKKHFISCKKGKFDYCYAFIEASLGQLAPDGLLAYIIPNSIFKNVYAKELRTLMQPHISKIIDYSGENIFNDALTSSVIFICKNKKDISNIDYSHSIENRNFKIEKIALTDKWLFIDKEIPKRIQVFGDIFHAAIGIATLYNKAFVLDADDLIADGNYYLIQRGPFKGHKIEAAALRPCASPRSKAYNKNHYIIYPYFDNNGIYGRFTNVHDFRNVFPRTAEYLQKYKTELLNRAADKSSHWFEYGRSQALRNLNQQKLLLSTIITNRVFVYDLDELTIPYSGIYIVSRDNNNLQAAREILESPKFFNYVQSIGITANGTSKRITVRDINNFII